jgi:hypothetical protein
VGAAGFEPTTLGFGGEARGLAGLSNGVEGGESIARGGDVTSGGKPRLSAIHQDFGAHLVPPSTGQGGASAGRPLPSELLTVPQVARITHRIDPVQVGFFLSTVYPAALDPAFAQAVPPYDPGYVTTLPGTRYDNFYAPGVTEAAVVAVDEANKDVLSFPESATAAPVFSDPTVSQSIGVPVLAVLGELDTIFICSEAGPPCTASELYAQEAPFYSAAACLQTFVLPEAGHSFNLFPNAHHAWKAVTNWADDFVGRGPGPVTPPPGACP